MGRFKLSGLSSRASFLLKGIRFITIKPRFALSGSGLPLLEPKLVLIMIELNLSEFFTRVYGGLGADRARGSVLPARLPPAFVRSCSSKRGLGSSKSASGSCKPGCGSFSLNSKHKLALKSINIT